MWYLFLDESGDLGFDFVSKKPSRYFTICVLATSDPACYRALRKAVKKTLRRKVNQGGRATHLKYEVKGTGTTIGAKRHFYSQVASFRFGIYGLTLNKRRVFDYLTRRKDQVYNFVARKVLDQIPFDRAADGVILAVDRSKGKAEIREFNQYIIRQLQGRLDPKVPLDINHLTGAEEPALQAADLFSWGIFRKYEKSDMEWYDVFRERVLFDEVYLG